MYFDHHKPSAPKHAARLGCRHSNWYEKLGLTICAAMLLNVSTGFARLQDEHHSVTSAYECTQVAIDEVDQALLTKQERIALLDDSLTQSIDSYSTCVSTAAQTMSGGGAGQSENGQGGSQNGSGEQSTNNSENNHSGKSLQQQEQNKLPQEIPETKQLPIKGSGSTPAPRGIIPPKNNDKIICKLLFQEITKTQDPDMLDGLKQQYGNYKCG